MTALKHYIVSAILAIVMMQGDTLWATPNHPFWYKDGYIEASALRAGDTLMTVDEGISVVKEVTKVEGEQVVYNFTVADNNNYYVGHSGYLVHNDCFLSKIDDAPELISKIDALPPGAKGQFLQDFYAVSDDVINGFKSNPGCVKAWEVAAKHNDALRLDIGFLNRMDGHLATNPGLKVDLVDADLFNTYKKVEADYTQGYEILDDVELEITDALIQKVSNASEPSWWKWIVKGRKFEKEYLLPRLKDRLSAEYIQLKNKVQQSCSVNLDQYDMYSQVQFKYNNAGDYFVADQVYVKWGINPTTGIDEIQDIVIIENKLSSGTRLTAHQNGGKAASSLDVRSVELFPQSSVSGNTLTNQLPSINTNDKWFKIYDSENEDIISDIVRLKR